MITLDKVSIQYGVKPVIRNLSLQFTPGELVAIVGPNGMGKSTLLGAMAGLLTPLSGRIVVDGFERKASPAAEKAARQRIAYLPERSWLPMLKTGREFVVGVGELYGIERRRLLEHTDALLKLFDLRNLADEPIRSYSTGQQKKIALCSVFASEAKILLLDEPFSGGVDPSGIFALQMLLKRFVTHPQRLVIFATPIPELVEVLADRVVLLKEGQVLAFDTIEELGRKVGETNFARILEQTLHPESSQHVESYLENWKW